MASLTPTFITGAFTTNLVAAAPVIYCRQVLENLLTVGGALIRIGGMAKGSGMIHPNMATMLGVVTPDASIASTVWREMVCISVNRSFNQITVERLGRECCFFLIQSFPFDESTFGKLSGCRSTSRPMQASLPVSYVFHMHPPSDRVW